jgi:hypothetical protein
MAARREGEGTGGDPVAREASGATESGSRRLYRLRTKHAATESLVALGEAVNDWGGEWTAGQGGAELMLPVQAGLRRGELRGRARSTALPGGSELEVEIAQAQWALDRSAVLLLTMAAITGVACVLWPFYPALAQLVPLGLVLGASAWLVILARLRHHGPVELLAQVEEALDGEAAPVEPPAPIVPT